MQRSGAPPACGGGRAAESSAPTQTATTDRRGAGREGIRRSRRGDCCGGSSVDRREWRSARGRRGLAGQRRGKRPLGAGVSGVKADEGNSQRRNQMAANHRCFSGKVRRAPKSSDRSTITDGGFLRFLPALNNPWIWATARHRAASGVNKCPGFLHPCKLKGARAEHYMPQLRLSQPPPVVDAPPEGGEPSRSTATRATISAMCCALSRRIGARVQRPRRRMAGRHFRPQAAATSHPPGANPAARRRPTRLCVRAAETCAARLRRTEGGGDGRLRAAAGADAPHAGVAGQHSTDARQCDRGGRAMRHFEPRRRRRTLSAGALSRPARRRAAIDILRRGRRRRRSVAALTGAPAPAASIS